MIEKIHKKLNRTKLKANAALLSGLKALLSCFPRLLHND